jgi:hypothetical protein
VKEPITGDKLLPAKVHKVDLLGALSNTEGEARIQTVMKAMEHDYIPDILFLESHLQELNDQLASHIRTTLQRKQIEDRIQIISCLIEHLHLNSGDVSLRPAMRKPPLSEHSTQYTEAEAIDPAKRAALV